MMGAADHSEADRGFGEMTTPSAEAATVDRSHNRDTLSSEAMTEMLRDLQDSMLALDERLTALEAAQGAAVQDTGRLARGVVEMGDALARRLRTLEQVRRDPPSILVRREPAASVKRPRPPSPQHRLAWIAALVIAVIVVLATFWLLATGSLDRATPIPPPAQVVATPSPSLADTPPAAASPPPPPAPHVVAAPHHATPTHKPAIHSHTTPNEPSPPSGFAHYGPSPSTQPPPPASAPPHSPS